MKLDESLSPRLKEVLSRLGHDVSTVRDQNLQGQADARIAEVVRSEGRMLLTLDVDFGNLTKHPPGSHPGIIVFRLRDQAIDRVLEFAELFFRENDVEQMAGCVVVAEAHRTRIRRPEDEIGA